MDEKQAIQRLKRGDIGGLEFLVSRFQTKAIRVAYLIYIDTPPTGKLTLEFLLMETVSLKGPWTLTWTPPGK